MKKVIWTVDDVGCYADEASGEGQRRERLADLLEHVAEHDEARAGEVAEIVGYLAEEPSDDYSEEDEALEVLADYTEDHYGWELDGGLMLRQIEPLFNHTVDPDEDGCHPDRHGLVLFEIDQHYGSCILTSPAAPGKDALIDWDDWSAMVGDSIQEEEDFAYLTDEYLEVLEEKE